MPQDIAKLAAEILRSPVRIDVSPASVTVDRIDQRVYFVPAQVKSRLLTELLADSAMDRVLVFTRTKRGADRVCKFLRQSGVAADALHGNKAQNARVRALEAFRSGQIRTLVATDIAARGIDVSSISHVINYELPHEPESYVHRIGRTARAGAGGMALSFCDGSERSLLKAIERLTKSPLSVIEHRLAQAEPVSQERRPERRTNKASAKPAWRPERQADAATAKTAWRPERKADAAADKPTWRPRGRRNALPSARGGLARQKATSRVSFSGEPR
jgi:ATP-dependent RNA helicase RhlE